MRVIHVTAISLAGVIGMSAPTHGQTGTGVDALAPLPQEQAVKTDEDFEFKFTFGGAYTHRFDTDIDSGGDFSNDTLSFGLTVDRQLSDEVSLKFQTNYVVSSYDFTGTTGLAAFDPWDDIHTFNFGAALSFNPNDELGVFAGPVFQFSRESGADWTDGFTGGGIMGMTYQVSDRLVLGGGIGIVSQIEDDVRVFPIIIIEWQLADQWRISSRGPTAGRASLEFTGVELIWSPAERWEFALGGGSSFSRFRLDDSGFAPDGVGEDESIPLWLRASWKASNTFSIDAVGGFAFGGELTLDDSNGDGIARSDYDTSPFVGVLASIRF
jgi:hypothetical protein